MSASSSNLSRSPVGEFRQRYKWITLAALIAFLVVVGRLFQLQVLDAAEYAGVAHENIIRRVTLATTRGVIRDANGRVLASSRPSYNVEVIPGRAMPSARPPRYRNGQLLAHDPDSWPELADTLRLNPEERRAFEARMRAACVNDEDKSPCFRTPILVREDVPRDIVAELRQHRDELAGVDISSAPVRFYPYGNLGAHMLGYVAEIDSETLAKYRPPGYEDLARDDQQRINPLGYEAGDTVGATGIEHAWESYLRGQRGWEKRVVDARGRYRSGPEAERLIDAPGRLDPIAGRDLRLSMDVDLEQAIAKAMRPHAAGAAVVVDVRTGRLLAMYSKPDFDPNDLSGGAGRARVREAFNHLYADPLRPMLDKTMSGAFQPGSTMKPFSALAALEDHLIDPDHTEKCEGYVTFGRRIFRCSHVHGPVRLHEAIARSCNVYFFHLAETVGMDRIARIAQSFGLGEKTGLGINPEAPGRIPTRSWYALRYRGQFRVGFTLNMAIGEGDVTVTPLQLAVAYSAIANGGTLYQPQVVRAVETSDGTVVQEFPPRIRRQIAVSPDNLKRVSDALYEVVNDPNGTAYPARDAVLDVAGKTGTAQTGYVPKKDDEPKMAWFLSQNHAWFSSFAPARSPEVAVTVLVEHGGSGPEVAVPVAMQIIREYERLEALRLGKPPPPKPPPMKPKAVTHAEPGGHP
ncbi:MAG TPA: penicillin-binding protein 2 [Polyangiaceae bacterium]|jgi:penicillin-binding protein 2|nr:penicillin-binding protein 2 [Polyangiaceae bacterium]